MPSRLGGLGRSGQRQSSRYRTAGGGGRARLQMFSRSIRESSGFTMVTEQELRGGAASRCAHGIAAAGACGTCAARWTRRRRRWLDADWRSYATYLKSRPDEAELSAIRLLLSLCREYRFRLHIVHLATCEALVDAARRARGGASRSPWKRARTICIWPPRRSPTERRFANARRRFAAARIAKNCGRASETA